MSKKIAIDGPSGAGKSTLSRLLAQKLGFVYVDTGAIYRTIGLYVYRQQIDPDDEQAVTAVLPLIHIDIRYIGGEQRVCLNGEDVSSDIRIHAVSDITSKISAYAQVRQYLLETQRRLADEYDVIMDGRDIGSVILPDADVKLFLTASAEERAKRRFYDLIRSGEQIEFETVLRDVVRRDERDMHREVAPLTVAPDAIVVDTTEITFEQSLEKLIQVVTESLA